MKASFQPSPRRSDSDLLFKEGLDGGVLSDEQITLADRVLSMQSLTVQSEMVPWTACFLHRVEYLIATANTDVEWNATYTNSCSEYKMGMSKAFCPS